MEKSCINTGERLKIYRYILIIFVFFIPVFQGCGSAILRGAVQSRGQNAILNIAEHNNPDTVVGIEQIDQQSFPHVGSIQKTSFKLRPGKHQIRYYFLQHPKSDAVTRPFDGSGTQIVYGTSKIVSEKGLDISFTAVEAHVYTLKNYCEWGNGSQDRVNTLDFLTMIIDTTEGRVVSWESRGRGDFKKEVMRQTGLKFSEASEKKALETNRHGKKKNAAICGDDYCEQGESHSGCPADCFPVDIRPTDLSEGDKAVFMNFVYKGQRSGIFFVVNKDVHEKIAALPRSIIYERGKEKITKRDFILPKLNNRLQREKLLPLVKKIKSLTPDVNKQARIAISLVQNIPYDFPVVSSANTDYTEKYPYGVLWEQAAACSEKSDLLLFLLKELGFGAATLIYKKEDHRSVGIKCPDAYDVGDSGYCYVEVTGPKIITDNLSRYKGVGNLTDFTVIKISDGRQLEGVEEEFNDKKLYYDLINRAKAQNGTLKQDDYDLYNSILNKYGMEKY